MRVCYDFEFIEHEPRTWPAGRRVRTIEPISLGMVAEDGREYYAVNRDMPVRQIRRHPWLMANVVPHLPTSPAMPKRHLFDRRDPAVKPVDRIAADVAEFLLRPHPGAERPNIELWAWYGPYDYVCLAWLWGHRSAMPKGIPHFTYDIKQETARLGNPLLPRQPDGAHHALEDARHNLTRLKFLADHRAAGDAADQPG